ncbi:MAG: histidine triad nucleotide-binding protein [Candidatus Kerfeldbacteria bacterium]|nr:histidine triad nucleotide-binding protein [Candidatus Kerfeldbacteria bacterium]
MDCIFCKIAAHDIPAKVVLETDQVIVIHDIAPKAKVHVLAIPKQHLVTFTDLTEDNKALLAELGLTIKQAVQQLGIAESGYKVIINNGHDGGQAVPHLHAHVLGGERVKGIT